MKRRNFNTGLMLIILSFNIGIYLYAYLNYDIGRFFQVLMAINCLISLILTYSYIYYDVSVYEIINIIEENKKLK